MLLGKIKKVLHVGELELTGDRRKNHVGTNFKLCESAVSSGSALTNSAGTSIVSTPVKFTPEIVYVQDKDKTGNTVRNDMGGISTTLTLKMDNYPITLIISGNTVNSLTIRGTCSRNRTVVRFNLLHKLEN